MSINETQYRIDIEALQRALGVLPGESELTITSESVVLVEYSDGQAGPPLRGIRAIVKRLTDAVESFIFYEG